MSVSFAPPPASIARDDYAAADIARKRLAPKSRLPHFLSLPNLKVSSKPTKQGKNLQANPIPRAVDDPIPDSLIVLDPATLDTSDEYTDKYEWAIVYENQRGVTLFSTPYYSRLSLLPSDPPPFTIPSASTKGEQRSITLADYPLPDGTWKWVSKCWMIDMGSDSGEVQHDGFEYNWLFRKHKWSAEVGSFSAGGWVRRRRWIRLMTRPAKTRHTHLGDDPAGQSTPSFPTGIGLNTNWRSHSAGSSFPSSILPPDSDNPFNFDEAWIIGDVEGNWYKCRALMRRLGRDGRKIELWKSWLSFYHSGYEHAHEVMGNKDKVPQRQSTQDDYDTSITSETEDYNQSVAALLEIRAPSKECLIPVLREHGNELLQSFIYPDSRAKLFTLLGSAGLLPEIKSQPIQVALRTYVLSLSLSLGPSLVPFLTAFLTAKSSKTPQQLRRVLRRELGFDGFAFAMTLCVGGGAAVQQLWRALDDDIPKQRPTSIRDHIRAQLALLDLSHAHITFISNVLSSSFGILLLQAGRRRAYQLRNRLVSPNTIITPPTPSLSPAQSFRTSDTLDLTLMLVVRAVDSLLQTFIRKTTEETAIEGRTLTDPEFVKEASTKENIGRILTSRIDALVFWACSARIMWCFFYEPQRLPKSYVKWIAALANLDARVIQTLRLIREGSWSYVRGSEQHLGILTGLSKELGHNPLWGDPIALPAYGGAAADEAWKALGVGNRRGVGGLPCELAHFLPVIITRPQALLKPHRVLNSLFGAARSATFLSAFVTFYWSAVCITRSGIFAQLLPGISHDFWDGPYGRGEMALYVLPRALRACLPNSWVRNNSRNARIGERDPSWFVAVDTILHHE
ncbi:hypothetical protein H0H81_010756 [Sphagnurus paluster]|uniref:TECPR1-like DysF domain-containing protein n=1 Tax=Sphagnurus paluster TaxID=117069 RepID=A0A9P7FRC8_9AGAR|nr:hypothetical protein H0H81_010756 [Sphagnurus paluster]